MFKRGRYVYALVVLLLSQINAIEGDVVCDGKVGNYGSCENLVKIHDIHPRFVNTFEEKCPSTFYEIHNFHMCAESDVVKVMAVCTKDCTDGEACKIRSDGDPHVFVVRYSSTKEVYYPLLEIVISVEGKELVIHNGVLQTMTHTRRNALKLLNGDNEIKISANFGEILQGKRVTIKFDVRKPEEGKDFKDLENILCVKQELDIV